MSIQPSKRDTSRNKAIQESSIRISKGNENIAQSGGGECHESNFQRLLECFRMFQKFSKPSIVRENVQNIVEPSEKVLESSTLF